MLIVEDTEALAITPLTGAVPEGKVISSIDGLNARVHGVIEQWVGIDEAEVIVVEDVGAGLVVAYC